MDKLRAIIVDDEQDAREVLKYIITKYCSNVELVGIAENANQAYEIICKERPNVLLLDIQIATQNSPENSFDLLKRIPNYPYNIVFVTAYDKYAIQAIKIHAFDYLLKPVDVDELVHVFNSIQKEDKNIDSHTKRINSLHESVTANNGNTNSIWLNTYKGHLKILYSEIKFIKSIEKYIEIQLQEEKLFINQSLKEITELLPSDLFFKVHRSYLVNLLNIKEIRRENGEVYLAFNNEVIPVSRRKKVEFLKRVNLNK